MKIPKNKRLFREKKHKQCKEPGCKKMFWGIGVAKYCDKHRNPKNRAKKKAEEPDHSKNIYFKHRLKEETVIEFFCQKCGRSYRVKIEPKQYIYPAHCNECRRDIMMRAPHEIEHLHL